MEKKKFNKCSNLWDTYVDKENQIKTNLVFRANFGGECTKEIAKYDGIFLDYNEEKDKCLV